MPQITGSMLPLEAWLEGFVYVWPLLIPAPGYVNRASVYDPGCWYDTGCFVERQIILVLPFSLINLHVYM